MPLLDPMCCDPMPCKAPRRLSVAAPVLLSALLMTSAVALAPVPGLAQTQATEQAQAGSAVAGSYSVVSRTNVRAEASAQSTRIGQVEMGATVEVVGEAATAGWYRVRLANGATGHIIASQLRPLFVVPPAAPPAEAAPAAEPVPSMPEVVAAPVAPVEVAATTEPLAEPVAEPAAAAVTEPAPAVAPALPDVEELAQRLKAIEAMMTRMQEQLPAMEDLRQRSEALARQVESLTTPAPKPDASGATPAPDVTDSPAPAAAPVPATPSMSEVTTQAVEAAGAAVAPVLEQLSKAQADIANELRAQREELERAKPLLQEMDGVAQSLRGWLQQTEDGVTALADAATAGEDSPLNPLTMIDRLNRLQEQITTEMSAQKGEFDQLAEKLRSVETSVQPLVDWAKRLGERAGPAADEAQGWFMSTVNGALDWVYSFIYASPAQEPLPVVTDSVTVKDLPASMKR